ncbi:DVUA0089 family protein [Leptolyngbya sp. FACHB-541]|uniref:DVUA0089 family protein n=1 Tax=Leptolyngbya sp. FACHB-541 TaxID=2692810 RepID=UPI0018F01FEC|nr:DVUA0089 family protein [Leptolyngbya sp. FACHB-541]
MNKFIHSSVAAALTLVASVAVSVPAQAADFDFNGTFENDNDVLLFDFEVDVDSTVTVFSSSWVNGGFDPILSLFDGTGNLVNYQDDGFFTGSTPSNGVDYDYGVWDVYFTSFLPAGSYQASLTQFANRPSGPSLPDGFLYDGASNENFTAAFGCSQGSFCGIDSTDDSRTNAWELHFLNVAQANEVEPAASVPEPASLLGLLAISVLGGSSTLRRKEEV